MNQSLSISFAFLLGAWLSYIVTKKALEEKYDQRAQDEVASIRRAYEDVLNEKIPQTESTEKEEPIASPTLVVPETPHTQYAHLTNDLGYSKTEPAEEAQQQADDQALRDIFDDPVNKVPYIISPDDFGSLPGYDAVSWTYYSDGTVANDEEEALSPQEIEDTIGRESLRHYGEYEDDSIHVRNDMKRCDYEVLKSDEDYEDVLDQKPWLRVNR